MHRLAAGATILAIAIALGAIVSIDAGESAVPVGEAIGRLRCTGASKVKVVHSPGVTRVRKVPGGQLLLQVSATGIVDPGHCTPEPVPDGDKVGRHGLGYSDDTPPRRVQCDFKNKTVVLWYQLQGPGQETPASGTTWVGYYRPRASGDDFYASDRQQRGSPNLSYDGNFCNPIEELPSP